MTRGRDVLTFRVDRDGRRWLESEAKERGVTVSALVRAIISDQAEQAQLRNVCEVLKLLAEKVGRLENEVKTLRQEFEAAVR